MNFLKKRPLALCCVIFSISLALCFVIKGIIMLCVAAVGACGGIVFLYLKFFRRKRVALFAFFMCFSLSLGSFIGYFYTRNSDFVTDRYIDKTGTVTATLKSIQYEGTGYAAYKANITSFDGEKCDFDCLLVINCNTHPNPYTEISVEGKFSDFYESGKSYYLSNGMLLRFASSYDTSKIYRVIGKSKGLSYSIYQIREKLSDILAKPLSSSSHAFARAVFLGDRNALSGDVKDDFQAVGLSHMLALSGMHLSCLIGSFIALLAYIGISKKRRFIIGVIFCIFYIFLTGASYSVMRAGIMFTVVAVCVIAGRESDSVTSLFLAFAVISGIMPYTVFNAGLLLSFASTLGIVVIMPYFNTLGGKIRNRFLHFLYVFFVIPVFVSLSALAFAIPFFFIFFDYISILTVISNILINYPLTLLLLSYPILLVFAVILPPVGNIIGMGCNFITDIILLYCNKLGSLDGIMYSLHYPFVIYILIGVIAVSAVFFILNGKNPVIYLLIFALGVSAYTVSYNIFKGQISSHDKIACIADSQSDGFVLISNGKTAIFDISYGSDECIDRLFEVSASLSYRQNADFYFITHYHENGIENLNDYLKSRRVGTVYAPVPKSYSDSELYFTLRSYCNERNINFKTIEEKTAFNIENMSVSMRFLKISEKSTRSICEIKITDKDESFIYLGAGFSRCTGGFSTFAKYDYVFAGGNGTPKGTVAELPSFKSGVCSYAVYPYLYDSGFEKILDDYNEYTFDFK